MKPFIFAAMLVCAMLLTAPALGSTNQGIIQNGIGNSALQVGDDAYVHVDRAYAYVKETNTQYNSVTFEAPEQGPSASYLSTGDAAYTRLVYPNRIAVIKIVDNTSRITVRSGTPVALYTISANYLHIVQGSQAIPDYNEIYDRMDHGAAVWESWIPYFTTYETIEVPSTADYIVVDNRNEFTSYNLIEVQPYYYEEKFSY